MGFTSWFEAIIFIALFAIIIGLPCFAVAVIGTRMINDLGNFPTKAAQILSGACWKVLLAEIDLGFVPVARFQGGFTTRLEYLLELPKGKAVAYFDQTDMFRAKEVLGNHLCIMGNVPSSMLQVGSAQEVEECCRKLIQVCGKGGGFILVNGGGIDQANPANIKVMVDSVKKFQVS